MQRMTSQTASQVGSHLGSQSGPTGHPKAGTPVTVSITLTTPTHPSIYLTVGTPHCPMDGSLRDQIARWF